MIVNIIKQIIKQYKKYTFFYATKNIIYHLLTQESRKCFGKNNVDKTFYVIRGIDFDSPFYIGPTNHLLANYFYVLSHLKYAEVKGWIPIVDQLNYPTYNSIDKTNAWEYYWKQPCQYTLEEVYNSRNVVLSKRNWVSEWDMGYDIKKYKDEKIVSLYHSLMKKVPLNIQTQQYIKSKIVWPKGKIIGVAYRYGGHSKTCNIPAPGHPIQPDIEIVFKITVELMHKLKMDYIFISSDVKEAIEYFKCKLPNKVIYLDRLRYSVNLNKYEQNCIYKYNNISQTTLDYLTEVEYLAKCNAIIGSINSGFRYAVIKNNNKYEYKYIFDSGYLEDNRLKNSIKGEKGNNDR